jgi:hypothetical protein
MDILISSRHLILLRRYCAKTGLSIDLCVHDALVEWFRKRAPTTLVQLDLPHAEEVRDGAYPTLSTNTARDGSEGVGLLRRIGSLLRYRRT